MLAAKRRIKSYFDPMDFKIGSRHRDLTPARMGDNRFTEGAPMIDTKAYLQRFLAGDKDLVLNADVNEPKITSYQRAIKGI